MAAAIGGIVSAVYGQTCPGGHMVNRGDMVSGVDEHGRSVTGEVVWVNDRYARLEQTIYAYGRLWPGPCVTVSLSSCGVITSKEDRDELNNQYFEGIKSIRQSIEDRELER